MTESKKPSWAARAVVAASAAFAPLACTPESTPPAAVQNVVPISDDAKDTIERMVDSIVATGTSNYADHMRLTEMLSNYSFAQFQGVDEYLNTALKNEAAKLPADRDQQKAFAKANGYSLPILPAEERFSAYGRVCKFVTDERFYALQDAAVGAFPRR